MHKIINNYTQACWWIGALLCANLTACSSDSTIQEEDVYDNHTPMAFGSSLSSSEPASTRGVTSLEADFKVGTWKNFNQSGEQQVMDGYKVEYNASTSKWNYVGIGTQIQRYWDQSAFPYEFRAVSPYLNGATLAADKITIDVSAKPFKAQTYFNEVYNLTPAESEPCVVAQVSRLYQYVKDRSSEKPEIGHVFGLGVSGYLGSVIEIEAVAFPANEKGKGTVNHNGSQSLSNGFGRASAASPCTALPDPIFRHSDLRTECRWGPFPETAAVLRLRSAP